MWLESAASVGGVVRIRMGLWVGGRIGVTSAGVGAITGAGVRDDVVFVGSVVKGGVGNTLGVRRLAMKFRV